MSKSLSIILLFFLFASCKPNDKKSIATEKENFKKESWRELSCGLFIDSTGVIAFATNPERIYDTRESTGLEICENVFHTKFNRFGDTNTTTLSETIDTTTFHYIGCSMYMDKNYIYNWYAMCDGGYFYLTSLNQDRLTIINDQYYSYGDTIRYFRNGNAIEDANSFVVSNKHSMLGRDKNYFYRFGEKLERAQLDSFLIEDGTVNELDSLFEIKTKKK